MSMVKDDGACFICGQQNPIGFRIPFQTDLERKSAEGRTVIPEHFQGWQGIVHGGILAALLDEVCMHACRTIGNQLVTAELTVRYREPVPAGREVLLSGEVCGEERRVILAKGRILFEGRVAAEAHARIFRLRS